MEIKPERTCGGEDDKKDDLLNDMKLYDLTENYEGNISLFNLYFSLISFLVFLKTIESLSQIDFEINNEELELFTRCFKNYIGGIRTKFRKICAIINRNKISSKDLINFLQMTQRTSAFLRTSEITCKKVLLNYP